MLVEGNLTAVCYRDEIVRQYVIPFIHNSQRNVIMQQENAGPHTKRVVNDNLQQLVTLVCDVTGFIAYRTCF